MIKYIESPLFIIESLYDTSSIPNILGLSCLEKTFTLDKCSEEEMLTIDAFRVETMNQLVKAHKQKSNRAIWSPACLFHCFCDNGSDDRA
jgi:hypothetical protein